MHRYVHLLRFFMPISAPFIYEADVNLGRVEKSDILGRNFKELRSAICTWWKTRTVLWCAL